MEMLIINISEEKTALVKQLLKELGVTINSTSLAENKLPNILTAKVIKDAHKGKGLGEPIADIRSFVNAL